MFYEISTVENFFLCINCNQKYDEPRILPCCGETVCISSMKNEQKLEINCKLCSNTHQIPSNGFLINKSIMKLMLEQPKEIFRNRECEELKSLIKEIKNRQNKLEFNIENEENSIKEHSRELKRLVQLKTEQAILEINRLNEKLIDDIDQYEQEWHANFKNKEKFNTTYYDDLKPKLSKCLNDSNDYLQQIIITDQETTALKDRLDDLKSSLDFELNNFDKFLFDDQMVLFKEIKQEINFGYLYKNNTIFIDSLRKFSLNSFRDNCRGLYFWGVLKNKICFLGSQNNDKNKIVIISFDKTLNNSPEQRIICDSKRFFFARNSNELIALFLQETNDKFVLKILNDSFQILLSVEGVKYNLKGINENRIFCFDPTNEYIKIYSFTENTLVQDSFICNENIFQHADDLLKQIDIHNDHLIILFVEKILIFEIKTKTLIKTIKTNVLYFNIDLRNDYIYYQENGPGGCHTICRYDLNGNAKSETLIAAKDTELCYSSTNQDNAFTFFNFNSMEFYF